MSIEMAGLCFSDGPGMAFSQDPRLVALSYLIAVGGSFASLEMIERWRGAQGWTRLSWKVASAGAFGACVWSMHFVAILALRIDMPITYRPGQTLLSLAIPIAATAIGLQIVRPGASWARIGCAGATVGLGIAAMHYVGMAALQFPGALSYRPSLWALSVLVGMAAATAALWLSMTLKTKWHRGGAALVMGAAICGMHYTGMAAAVFQPDPLLDGASGLQHGPLVAGVAAATLALIACALVLVAADRRVVDAALREAAVLRAANRQLEEANAELSRKRQQLELVLTNMTHGVCMFDESGRLLVWNQRYAEIYRIPLQRLRVGMDVSEIIGFSQDYGDVDDMAVVRQLAGVSTQGKIVELVGGAVISVHHNRAPGGGWVVTHEDITERHRAQASVAFMARHDALTKLPNRVLFQERLYSAMDDARQGPGFAVLCIDLDHFKRINDSMGHTVGDGLLQRVADRLLDCVRRGDTVARLGGDEFAIIMADVGHRTVDTLCHRILDAFHDPVTVESHHIMVRLSIGVALANGRDARSDNLLKHADIALYLAKSEGRGDVRFFEPEMDERIQTRITLELDLREALHRDEMEVYYQPLVNLSAGIVSGFEALVRWNHPIRGLVSPSDFIAVAEETGLIVDLGAWVLKTACCEAMNWPGEIGIAVNLSAVQFQKGDVLAAVETALRESGLNPARLELEMTESVLLQGGGATLSVLHRLRAMGIGISLDDFGTGYSSLSYLHDFPFDKIKIDQSFVRDLGENEQSMSIVRAVAGLGRSLNMKTIAEGVETIEQLNHIRTEGCTEVQGFIFSQPMPAAALPGLIESIGKLLLDYDQLQPNQPDRRVAA